MNACNFDGNATIGDSSLCQYPASSNVNCAGVCIVAIDCATCGGSAVTDCNNVCNGTATYDVCGVCGVVSPLAPARPGILWIVREFAGVERPMIRAVCAMEATLRGLCGNPLWFSIV